MDTIVYNIHLKDNTEYTFKVAMNRPARMDVAHTERHAFWTKINYHQCTNCPLQPLDSAYCPAALDIEEIAGKFEDVISTEKADVWVHTKDRSFFKNCDIQEALKSFFGLVMATGSCPILSRLKPLAYFHLPFATFDETIQRLVGMYLIKQHLIYCEGKSAPDWNLKGIEELYTQLEKVNIHLMHRLRDASSKDANLNALYLFVTLTSLIATDLKTILAGIDPILKKSL